MDPVLVEKAKAKGVYPLNLDLEAQTKYLSKGIEPSNVHVFYPEGFPSDEQDRYDRIQENILLLTELDKTNQTGTPEYQTLEDQLKTDLHELRHFPPQVKINNTSPQVIEDYLKDTKTEQSTDQE